jgi:hypothetical protein
MNVATSKDAISLVYFYLQKIKIEEDVLPQGQQGGANASRHCSILSSNISNEDNEEEDRKPSAVTPCELLMDSSFSMSDSSSERTILYCSPPVASLVAKKRPSSNRNHHDDDDLSMEAAPRVRRSHHVKTPNTFFDPGMGEPDSLWVNYAKNPRMPVEHVTRDNAPFSATGQPTTLSHFLHVDHGANTTVRDFLPIERPNFSLVFRQGRQVVTFPSSRSMDSIADVKKAWVVEKMTNTLFKYLDEKSWKDSIQEKVEVALADMASNGKKYHSSKQAARKALAESINSSDLAKELATAICESFVLEIIKARAIENVLDTALEEWFLGWMSPMRSEFSCFMNFALVKEKGSEEG